MEAELNLLEVWIPEQMEPGTMFMLEQAGELGKVENPFWAVLACPSCGSLGLITRQQWAGLDAMICGADNCSAEYFLEEEKIRFRLANQVDSSGCWIGWEGMSRGRPKAKALGNQPAFVVGVRCPG